jgi:hypothetical protein
MDIRDVDVVVFHGPNRPERKEHMERVLSEKGLRAEYVLGPSDQSKTSCTKSLLSLFKKRLEGDFKPFILLEDDCSATEWFRHVIPVPKDTDAVYLGISAYGLHPMVDQAIPRIDAVPVQEFPELVKLRSMLSTHAILYNTRAWVENCISCYENALAPNAPGEGSWDIPLARSQGRFNVYALRKPLFYQDAKVGGQQEPTLISIENQGLTCIFTQTASPFFSPTCTGLGNVLFQIAAIHGIAKETGRVPEFIDMGAYLEKVKYFTGHDYTKNILRNVPREIKCQYHGKAEVPHMYNDNFKEQLVAFVNNNYAANICLEGHFESHHYFSSCTEEMRTMFQPDPESLAYMKAKYPILFDQSKKCCSIHMRKHNPHFNDDMNYIKRGIEYLPSDTTYVVLSNDIELAKKELEPLGKEFIYADQNPDFIDLWIMSQCRYNIMSRSTFAWWGAFLNTHKDKVVICPKTMQDGYPSPISNFYFDSYVIL